MNHEKKHKFKKKSKNNNEIKVEVGFIRIWKLNLNKIIEKKNHDKNLELRRLAMGLFR